MNHTGRILCYLAARMREFSTWRDGIIILTALGYHFTPEQSQAVLTIGLLAAGVLGAAFPDRLGGATRADDQPKGPPDDPQKPNA